jgi:ABC-type branched-subunit amino acid transport system substrate-binding protein
VSDSTPTTAAGWTRNAIQEINSGEVSDARQMLAAALRLDPDYETAWIWFASIATDDAERRYCYERALAINPASVVAERLARLRTTDSTPPPELEDMEAPPLPEEFGGEHLAEKPGRSWLPMAAIAAIVLGTLIAGIWVLWPRGETSGEPVYIAFAAGLSGSGAESAVQMQRGLQVYVDYANSGGGIDGRPLEIVSFDDQDNPEIAAEVAREIVEDDRFVAVVGHRLSSTSLAAAPIYAAAGIPMITPTATADDVTSSCDWCFRTVFDNSTQGKMIASYVYGILDIDQAVIVSEDSDYGTSLVIGFASVFEEAGGTISAQYVLPADESQAGESIQQAAEEISREPDSTVILLATGSGLADSALIALRNAGVDGTIFGSDSTSSGGFLQQANAASEAAGGGVVTDGYYASAPLFVDSLNGDSVRLATRIQDKYGDLPSWRSFTAADAGVAIVNGLRSIDSIDAMPLSEQRSAIRDRWLALDSPENSIPAFVGPLYFDANRTAPRPVAIGIASGDLYDSAPRQIALASSVAETSSDEETIDIGGNTFVVQRVVQTGVDFNLIRDLNTVAETFYADFFVWFKYFGADDAADVVFTNISDPQTLTIDEVRSTDVEGLQYRVYRVTGTFTSPLNFHAFPFDAQDLLVHFQNRTLPSYQLVYAIDSDFAQIPNSDRLTVGGHATESISQINNWHANELEVFAGSVGTSSNLGDPEVKQASQGIEFSQVGVTIDISRNVAQFLLKNLLPLILLLAITYISLFFSHDQTTERVSFGITGVLTGAVLLSTVVSVLPDVGYTVAIEWAFYGFILLSAFCILVALIGGKLNEAKQISEMRALDLAARIGYPILVGAAVLGYWAVYG